MAASVRIEDEAFSDVRYDLLATLCQLADADHARGKMAKLWRQCTAQSAYVLSESLVCAILGGAGAVSLIESGLGERVEAGIRIRGTRGRIEWLKKLRNNAKKGGRAKAAKRQTQGKQEAAKSVPPAFPPAPAPAPVKEDQRSASPPAARSYSCPDDWQPDGGSATAAAIAKAAARGVDPIAEVEAMRDWSRGAGTKGRKADWNAAYRNWLRNARVQAARPPEWQRQREEIREIQEL